MRETLSALMVFILLLAGTGVGFFGKPYLPEEHRRHETLQLIQLVMTMLVTFAALVLGLLTASAKSSFDTVGNDFRSYAAALIQLDTALREYGPDADSARKLLRTYTAAAIASTWPGEQAPPGSYPRFTADLRHDKLEDGRLGDILNASYVAVRQLKPADSYQERTQAECLARFERVIEARWTLIEEAHSSISIPFLTTLTFWLMIIFLSFGLVAPRNALALVMIMLGAVSIASAVYVIVDLDTPLTGPIISSSTPMRNALEHLDRAH
ncbi:hypothetical protein J8I87_04105 [Paraburkholderia sp. LEh10]|uniref:bestrophin-like domain n=1 Tax=Paraburkholderia sp. LEh10 TaxID=2821353 RepID=UPI001AE9B8E6|nr:hypothetical protein [Paraburkholderia sp. LEh10]MBP0588917.1 hypothetical protein [Paraburkholderia sp. LEh10]